MKRLTWHQAQAAGLATARAFTALAIPAGTIRRWAHEGRITAQGKAPGGAHLYDIGEVSAVAETINTTPRRRGTCK
jgi:hypothetical protein